MVPLSIAGCLRLSDPDADEGDTPTGSEGSTPGGSTDDGTSSSGPLVRLWERRFENELDRWIRKRDGSLAVIEDGDDGRVVHKLSPDDGSRVGGFGLPDGTSRTTLYDGGLVCCGSGFVAPVEWSDGRVEWEASVDGSPLGVTVDRGEVLVGLRSWEGSEGRHGKVQGISTTSRSLEWSVETEVNVNTPPVATDEHLVFTASNRREEGGTLYGYDRETKERLWKRETRARFRAPPVVIDGTLYGGSSGNYNNKAPPSTLFALDPDTGEAVWERTGSETLAVDSRPMGVGSDLLFHKHLGLQRTARSDGSEVWERMVNEGISTTLVRQGGTAYAGTYQGNILAFDISDGEVLWEGRTSGQVKAVFVDDGTIYWVRGASLIAADIRPG